MKLRAKGGTYLSPQINQGSFAGAFVEDIAINHRRRDHYLSVTFGLSYEQDGKVHTLAKSNLIFQGLESGPKTHICPKTRPTGPLRAGLKIPLCPLRIVQV